MAIAGFDDLEKRMKATFHDLVVVELSSQIYVEYDNAPQNKHPEGEPWVRFSIRPGETDHAEMGGPNKNTWRYFGMIVVNTFVPFGTGNSAGNAILDKCAGVYRGQEINEILYMTFSKETIGRRNQWWQVNGTAPYYADLFA